MSNNSIIFSLLYDIHTFHRAGSMWEYSTYYFVDAFLSSKKWNVYVSLLDNYPMSSSIDCFAIRYNYLHYLSYSDVCKGSLMNAMRANFSKRMYDDEAYCSIISCYLFLLSMFIRLFLIYSVENKTIKVGIVLWKVCISYNRVHMIVLLLIMPSIV